MAGMDFSAPTGMTKTGRLVRTRIEPCSVDELVRMKDSLGEGQLRAFRREYGDILDLLGIPVPEDALHILSQFWDNLLRCFVFPYCHLSLVLEEYASLLRMPVHEGTPIFSYPSHPPSRAHVAELLQLAQERVSFVRRDLDDAIPLKFLVEYMAKLGEQKRWPLFRRVLALSIYGVVLFPAASEAVDFVAISVFMAVEYRRVNPVPAILADTIISLVHCSAKRKGKLKCCLQLLTAWLGNHIFGKDWSRGVRQDQVHHPLRDFCEREGKMFQEGLAIATRGDWATFFNRLSSQDIRWKLVWWEDEQVIFSCGDFHNVPLIGARGGVNYNPSMALKQLAYKQEIPSQELLQPFYFLHGDQSTEQVGRIAQAWRSIHYKGRVELGIRGVYTSAEFDLWMLNQVNNEYPPTFPSPNPLMGKADRKMKEAIDAEIARQKEEIENLLAEKERQKKEIKRGKEEYVQIHRDLRGLKRRGEPSRVNWEEELELEVEKLRAEMAACKLREHETQQRLEAEKKLSGDLQTELRAEKKRTMEAYEEKKELALHLEQERGASDILQEEIEDMANAHIKRVEELVWSRAEFQRESHELRARHDQIGRWVNMAVPTFSDTFYRAEDSMKPFYSSPELQSFLNLSRCIIEMWDELRRPPM